MTDPLLIGIKKGDMKAFNSLYQKYYKPLCYIAMHLLGDILLAEEVTDDVMIYIWHHRQDIETDSKEIPCGFRSSPQPECLTICWLSERATFRFDHGREHWLVFLFPL